MVRRSLRLCICPVSCGSVSLDVTHSKSRLCGARVLDGRVHTPFPSSSPWPFPYLAALLPSVGQSGPVRTLIPISLFVMLHFISPSRDGVRTLTSVWTFEAGFPARHLRCPLTAPGPRASCCTCCGSSVPSSPVPSRPGSDTHRAAGVPALPEPSLWQGAGHCRWASEAPSLHLLVASSPGAQVAALSLLLHLSSRKEARAECEQPCLLNALPRRSTHA